MDFSKLLRLVNTWMMFCMQRNKREKIAAAQVQIRIFVHKNWKYCPSLKQMT